MKIKSIDLNCDMGELLPGHTSNYDADMMPFLSSCNVSCGFHSGNPVIIEKTIRAAIENKVAIGAHPSYDDRDNFGRRSLDVSLEDLIPQLRYQIYAVKGIVESFGVKLHHVKAHGALYNDMTQNAELADAFVRLVKHIDPTIKIYVLAHSLVSDVCQQHDMNCVNEVFADRRYDKIDQLRSRKNEDAVLHKTEEVLSQIEGFIHSELDIGGTKHPVTAETICLHSDTKNAVQLSQDIYHHIKKLNVDVSAP